MADYGVTVPVGHRLEADALSFLNDMAANTTTVIEKDLNRFGGLKFTLVLAAALEKPNPGTDDNVKPDVITTIAFLRSKVETVLNSGEIMQRLADARTKIMKNSPMKVQAGVLSDVKIYFSELYATNRFAEGVISRHPPISHREPSSMCGTRTTAASSGLSFQQCIQ